MRNQDDLAPGRSVVRLCRALWRRHLVSGTSGNITVLLPRGDILATPSGRSFATLEPHELVLLSPDGIPQSPAQRPTSELPLHLAAYDARADIRCVVHTHPTYCVVWSKTGAVFPRDTVGASESLKNVAFTPYAKNRSIELAESVAAAFKAGADVVIMERHGITAVASTLEDAYMQTDLAEEAARIAVYSGLLFGKDGAAG